MPSSEQTVIFAYLELVSTPSTLAQEGRDVGSVHNGRRVRADFDLGDLLTVEEKSDGAGQGVGTQLVVLDDRLESEDRLTQGQYCRQKVLGKSELRTL